MANEPAPRPNWLDDNFLRKCIINSKQLPPDTNVDVDDVKLTYVVAKGENYMSTMYRVTLKCCISSYANVKNTENGANAFKTESFVLKVGHDSEQHKMIANILEVFPKETDMYVNIIPTLTKVLEDAGIKANISCRCLGSIDGEVEVLALEDLKSKGYVLANRLTGLDLVHSKIVLDKLAKLHAASMHYYAKKDPPEMYKTSPYAFADEKHIGKLAKTFEEALQKKASDMIEELSKDSKYHKHVDFFKQYQHFTHSMIHSHWPLIPGNKFNAMNHGDCWVNNMMFKYDEDGNVADVILIDLQISFYTSVGADFYYFFFTSTNNDVRKNHFKEIQIFYIDSLASYLKKLHYEGEIPTIEEFDQELKRISLIPIYVLLQVCAIILKEYETDQKDRNNSEVFEMDDIMRLTKTSPQSYMDTVRLSIECMEENGYFDKMPTLKELLNNEKK